MFFLGFKSFAQEMNGSILSDGQPLIGVNVINKTSKTGSLSDFDGNFSLNSVKPGDEIEFSYLGFESQTLIYNGETNITIILEESEEKLDEVIVIGYGSQIQKNLSSSIARVSGEEIARTPLASFEQALQGRAAGVQVTSGGAMSGSMTKIRIRGAGSVS